VLRATVALVTVTEVALLARVGTGIGLSYALGFERQLRGAIAGDRTFSLVGASAAAITAVAASSSPQAIAGVVTGIGFIGAGVVFRGRSGVVHGVTTAATLFAAAAIGIVVGEGHLWLGAVVAASILLILELPHVPGLKVLDARRYADRFANDPEMLPPDPPEPPT
jgi:putative Mg2+ transporter-C (MgtC) family protein